MHENIAIASARLANGIPADDLDLQIALRERGCLATVRVWNDPNVDWSTFDAVLIRSTWDYHKNHQQFLTWLDRLDALSVRVLNDTKTLRWNMDKKYLPKLARAGIPIIPTHVVDVAGIEVAAQRWREREVVVKPSVSGGAWKTLRGHVDDASFLGRLRELPQDLEYLVQPFLPEVVSEGEWSLIFIGNRYSHAVLKRPAHGDYRVQSEHGGEIRVARAPAYLRECGQAVLQVVNALGMADPTYARIDGVMAEDMFLLMELELIEPHLFLAQAKACEVLADQVCRDLRVSAAVA